MFHLDKIAQMLKTEVVAFPVKVGWLKITAVQMKQREGYPSKN